MVRYRTAIRAVGRLSSSASCFQREPPCTTAISHWNSTIPIPTGERSSFSSRMNLRPSFTPSHTRRTDFTRFRGARPITTYEAISAFFDRRCLGMPRSPLPGRSPIRRAGPGQTPEASNSPSAFCFRTKQFRSPRFAPLARWRARVKFQGESRPPPTSPTAPITARVSLRSLRRRAS